MTFSLLYVNICNIIILLQNAKVNSFLKNININGEHMKNDKFIIKKRKKIEYEQFTCRIETELMKKLRILAIQTNTPSLNELINESIRFALDNVKIVE